MLPPPEDDNEGGGTLFPNVLRRRRAKQSAKSLAAMSSTPSLTPEIQTEPGGKPKSGWNDATTTNAVELANIPDFHFEVTEDTNVKMGQQEDDTLPQIAIAPKLAAPVVPTIKDLEKDLRHAIPHNDTGIDLSLLISVLSPPASVIEPDHLQDFDSLLNKLLHLHQPQPQHPHPPVPLHYALQQPQQHQIAALDPECGLMVLCLPQNQNGHHTQTKASDVQYGI
ncbi:hypothetical protein Pelo_11766 [Pelomyxa schiedti]|nr:hypothetical protein Pelo_11766 [Pelomyxa schiedti]